ncbi:hypothetical protein CBR_g232 [Chara braunii]|uniref:adenylate kinase n=1 Tax=Chara braunii TaxID=69332 RepID=A0A388JM95_CHABU|nr:hypothetical protein CBR_g232 [Chara braunii]|eukprot:GBG58832.1 hypothetical protein CBR_g232 [Chara braunii]
MGCGCVRAVGKPPDGEKPKSADHSDETKMKSDGAKGHVVDGAKKETGDKGGGGAGGEVAGKAKGGDTNHHGVADQGGKMSEMKSHGELAGAGTTQEKAKAIGEDQKGVEAKSMAKGHGDHHGSGAHVKEETSKTKVDGGHHGEVAGGKKEKSDGKDGGKEATKAEDGGKETTKAKDGGKGTKETNKAKDDKTHKKGGEEDHASGVGSNQDRERGGHGHGKMVTGEKDPKHEHVMAMAKAPRAEDEEVMTVVVLGGPGCGKGTQCEYMVHDFDFHHLSVGDLLRDEVQRGTDIGKSCDTIMKEGKLVPTEMSLNLLRAAMKRSPSKRFLIDGFPRSIEQAEALESTIQPPTLILFFDCSLQTMETRLMNRAKTSGRGDDNPETIQKRLQTFLDATRPVADHYAKVSPQRFKKISAELEPQTVYKDVVKALNSVNLFAYGVIQKPGTQNTVIFVLGGPGSGKGMQCSNVKKVFKFVHLSVGDLLRDEVRKGTPTGLSVDKTMKEGELVPTDVALHLLQTAMERSSAKRFLIDGFPRTLDQAHLYEARIGLPTYVLYFESPVEILEARLLKRAETGSRKDDNVETIKHRLETFMHSLSPVINYYREKHPGILKVISSVPSADEVFAEVQAVLMSLIGA